jgi:uncharacterized protein DUF6049
VKKPLLAAAALMLVPLAIPAAPSADASTAGPRRSDEPQTGLAVSIEQITPAYLQPGERVNVSGTITNLDRETWREVQVFMLRPTAPATNADELADAAGVAAGSYSGNRICCGEGLFAELGPIAPDESVPYDLNIPFAQLGIPPDQYGVYTLGVQVRGFDPFGNRMTAGRARSFIPLMPGDAPSVGVATIWPFRSDIIRRPNGEYANLEDLIADISPGGRLQTILDVARTAGNTPISLLADPALLDALQRIKNDNTQRPGDSTPPGESPTTDGDTGLGSPVPTDEESEANRFLEEFTAFAKTQSLWAEGYGGPDLTMLSGDYDGTRMLRTIRRATATTVQDLGLEADRAYLPSGNLDVDALADLPPETTTFVTSEQVRRWEASDGPVGTVRSEDNRAPVVVTHTDLLEGSPAPGPTDTALQIRQRLLAETALVSLRARELSQSRAPSIAVLVDDDWDPGTNPTQADFFAAYDAPWIRPSNLDTELAEGPRRGAKRLHAAPLSEPPADPPLPESLARSADQIRGRGVIMWAITRDDPRILNFYDQSASLTVSDQWRSDPDVAQEIADRTITGLDRQIGRVTIAAPEFVTLSSSSGRFPLTITNDLTWPVRVGVQLKAEDGLDIRMDEPIDVEPQQSTTVNVQVNAEDVGVTEVTARLTTPNGRPFGEPVSFSMRSSVVGTVIWIAFGAAGAIVLLAVGRRIKRSRSTSAGESEPAASETR